MKGMLIALGVLALLVLIVGGCTLGSYNGLVSGENEVERSWANVQSAYQQRLDTLPKFAKTAKLSAEFQIALQQRYVAARNSLNTAAEAGDPAELESVANAQFDGLRSFLTIQVEAVPEAKTEQLTELNSQIESVERVIKHERDAYNQSVKNYKDKARKFPGSITAGMFGFDANKFKPFQASQEAQTSPDLDLDLDLDRDKK